MALPMLLNGADCGPVNPLQGLAKRFDQDRGIQQDQFGAGRAGPSREIFRTTQRVNPILEQEAARFFSGEGLQRGLASPAPATNAFDVSLLQKSLPVAHPQVLRSSSVTSQQADRASQQVKRSAWASDFLLQTRTRSADAVTSGKTTPASQAEVTNRRVMTSPGPANLGMQWTPPTSMMTRPQFAPQVLPSAELNANASAARLEEHFQYLEEASRALDAPLREQTNSLEQRDQDHARANNEADELARTAALLIETIKSEQNPKFTNSEFMRLMRGLRDGEVVVDGNDMVEKSASTVDTTADVKGKGKERVAGPIIIDPSTSMQSNAVAQSSSQPQAQESVIADLREEDPNEAYFRQDNEDYINYWNRVSSYPTSSDQAARNQSFGPQNEWGALQDSWDSFEATTWGVKPVSHYQFQPHNPYLNGEFDQHTRQHALHSVRSLYESVLELEAQVQRDPTDARAWYDLGVKQQENEREPKAIAALNRALELDSHHLPSRLALAISYTNEGDRSAADDAILHWVRGNQRYEAVVTDYFQRIERLNGGTLDSLSHARRHDELIHCLMAMARAGNERGEVDADVQIALAVLLNTSEDYLKAQDCFKAALSVRPDDWQLYNRVGATLANSGFSEEAFQYYYRALELNPAYIRVRFNLGIACMNMRRYDEAAQYVFDALNMQDSDGSVHAQDDKRGITSSTLWDSLRTSCIHLQRLDLAELCDRRDLEGFRRQFHV